MKKKISKIMAGAVLVVGVMTLMLLIPVGRITPDIFPPGGVLITKVVPSIFPPGGVVLSIVQK